MREFCTKNAKKSDDEVIEDLLFAILFNVKCEHSSPFDALEFINKFSVRLDVNKKKFPEFIRLYCELQNNTRNPFTPTHKPQKERITPPFRRVPRRRTANGFREPEMRQTAVILTLRISKRNCSKKAA